MTRGGDESSPVRRGLQGYGPTPGPGSRSGPSAVENHHALRCQRVDTRLFEVGGAPRALLVQKDRLHRVGVRDTIPERPVVAFIAAMPSWGAQTFHGGSRKASGQRTGGTATRSCDVTRQSAPIASPPRGFPDTSVPLHATEGTLLVWQPRTLLVESVSGNGYDLRMLT